MGSIGPKLQCKVVKGGSGIMDGTIALYLILDALQSEELTEVTKAIDSITKLSLKGSTNQDYTEIVTKVT